MYTDSEQFLDSIFLSYNKILKKLHNLGLTTKHGKEISHMDLRKAIDVMVEKYPTCRWRSEKIRSRNFYILIEGYYWLINVYFNSNKRLIDADIEFFITRIQLYEELLNVPTKDFFVDNMYVYELDEYFKRKAETIRKAILKMLKVNKTYRFIDNRRKNYV